MKAGPKKCPRDDHLKAGQSGFQMVTVQLELVKWNPVFKWPMFPVDPDYKKNLNTRINFVQKLKESRF